MLEACLNACFCVMEQTKKQGELIVVDNFSTDNSLKILEQYSPQITILKLKLNIVLLGYNRGVEIAKGRHVILLNNDETPQGNFIDLVLEPFERIQDLFQVSHQNTKADGSYLSGLTNAEFKKGQIWLRDAKNMDPAQSQFMFGGSLGTYSRESFLRLGGFSKLFLPFYWEDVDLSYRARKQGQYVWYEAKARAGHLDQATIKRLPSHFVKRVNRRNKILLLWLNLSDWPLIFRHCLHFPLFMLKHALKGDIDYLLAFGWILLHLPQVIKTRHQRQRRSFLADREIRELYIWD